MTLRSAKVAVLVCAISLAHSLSYGAAGSKSRIYSNVEYNEEGGDLLGYELEFQPAQIASDRSAQNLRGRMWKSGARRWHPFGKAQLAFAARAKFYGKVEHQRTGIQRPTQSDPSHGKGSRAGDHQTETYP